MSEDREILGTCECCSREIGFDDPHHSTADGCVLCEEHAPMLSDAIEQHEEIIGTVPFDPGELNYETRDQMKAGLAAMRAELAATGDKKLLFGVTA